MTEVFSEDVVYDVTDLGGGELRRLTMLRAAAMALGGTSARQCAGSEWKH